MRPPLPPNSNTASGMVASIPQPQDERVAWQGGRSRCASAGLGEPARSEGGERKQSRVAAATDFDADERQARRRAGNGKGNFLWLTATSTSSSLPASLSPNLFTCPLTLVFAHSLRLSQTNGLLHRDSITGARLAGFKCRHRQAMRSEAYVRTRNGWYAFSGRPTLPTRPLWWTVMVVVVKSEPWPHPH